MYCKNEIHYYVEFLRFALDYCNQVFTLIKEIARIFRGIFFVENSSNNKQVHTCYEEFSTYWIQSENLFIHLGDNKAFLKAYLQAADGPFQFLPALPSLSGKVSGRAFTQGREKLKYSCYFSFLKLPL